MKIRNREEFSEPCYSSLIGIGNTNNKKKQIIKHNKKILTRIRIVCLKTLNVIIN